MERGTSILDNGVETEEFGTVQDPAEEVQGPVAVTAAAVAVAVVAVLAAVVAAVVAAAVVVAEVVDTGTVGTSTYFQTGDFPITRIGDCVINSSRDRQRRLFCCFKEISSFAARNRNQQGSLRKMSSLIYLASSEHLRQSLFLT